MYFSISAPQQVTLPDGQVLSFRVNTNDSSLCEMHILGTSHQKTGDGRLDGQAVDGTHILTFKRNGLPQDTAFAATEIQPGQPGYKTNAPLTAEQIEANRVAQAQGKPAPYAADRASRPSYDNVDKDAVRADDWHTNDQSANSPADYQGLEQNRGIPRDRGTGQNQGVYGDNGNRPGNVNTTQTLDRPRAP